MCNDPDDSEKSPLEHRLKEIANYKVENLLLRKELDDVTRSFQTKIKWFEEQMKLK